MRMKEGGVLQGCGSEKKAHSWEDMKDKDWVGMSTESKQQQGKIIIYHMDKEEKGLVFLLVWILRVQNMMSKCKL